MNEKVCGERPPYSQGGKRYPTCGLACAGILSNRKNHPSTFSGDQNHSGYAAAPTRSTLRRSSRRDGAASITSSPSTSRTTAWVQTVTAQSSQNGPASLTQSRSQPPIAQRYFNTPPPAYTPFPSGRTPSQSGGYTPQRNANQYTSSPSRTISQRSGGGSHAVQRNPSQGGTVSQTYGEESRYSSLPSNPLLCVVSAPRILSI